MKDENNIEQTRAEFSVPAYQWARAEAAKARLNRNPRAVCSNRSCGCEVTSTFGFASRCRNARVQV